MNYTMVRTGPVDEISEAENAIEKHGGRILQRTTPTGDGSMGLMACFKDSEGNAVGLDQAPREPPSRHA